MADSDGRRTSTSSSVQRSAAASANFAANAKEIDRGDFERRLAPSWWLCTQKYTTRAGMEAGGRVLDRSGEAVDGGKRRHEVSQGPTSLGYEYPFRGRLESVPPVSTPRKLAGRPRERGWFERAKRVSARRRAPGTRGLAAGLIRTSARRRVGARGAAAGVRGAVAERDRRGLD